MVEAVKAVRVAKWESGLPPKKRECLLFLSPKLSDGYRDTSM